MRCTLCGADANAVFVGRLLNKYDVEYYQCHRCKLLFTETPYWINEAYKDSITAIDTGIMQRNIFSVSLANCLVNRFFDSEGYFLDYGGGYGVFTRMMRDLGYNWLWQDKFSPNLLARNFEYSGNENIELTTAFELLEHFDNPKKEFDDLFGISKNLLCSTLLYDRIDQIPKFEDWWYYVKDTGQHITFYSEETMIFISQMYDIRYIRISDSFHLFTEKYDINPFIVKLYQRANLIRWLQYKKQEKRSLVGDDMLYSISKKGEKKHE